MTTPTAIKLVGIVLGLVAIAGAAFLPDPTTRVILAGAGMGVLGWVGVRRPGDEKLPPETKPDPQPGRPID